MIKALNVVLSILLAWSLIFSGKSAVKISIHRETQVVCYPSVTD